MGERKKRYKRRTLGVRLYVWRLRNISDKQFVMFLSVIVGIATGLGAVLIKRSVHFVTHTLHEIQDLHIYYFVIPIVGISLALLFSKFIIRRPIRHGVPNVLFAKGKANGFMRAHNMFSSIITSALTVGFGGSVGLEGPTVSTGAAIGSNIGRFLHLRKKHIILLIGCACSGAMAAIFKAPIAAIVFTLEVIMFDLTMSSLVPLLLASSSAVLVSYLYTGQETVYKFIVEDGFVLGDSIYYVLLGVVTGVISLYFKYVYVFIDKSFEKIKSNYIRLILGGAMLGLLLFLLPPLYGEGYDVVNAALRGEVSYIFEGSIFADYNESFAVIVTLLVCIVLFKVVATALTFAAGGVGGIFAPTLFMGVQTGLLFAIIVNHLGFRSLNITNFALMGMGGLIAGVLHAPLTSIFLIAELSGGYELFVPLMLTSTVSYATIKLFEKHSVYTHQLATRKELITHHKDNAILSMININKLIETDFAVLKPDALLRDITEAISINSRNIFPVVSEDGMMLGMIKMNDIRHLIFKQELYDSIKVVDLMYMPEYHISLDDDMQDLVNKFTESSRYNIAVIDKGKYLGYISRAKAFTAYRHHLKRVSEE